MKNPKNKSHVLKKTWSFMVFPYLIYPYISVFSNRCLPLIDKLDQASPHPSSGGSDFRPEPLSP